MTADARFWPKVDVRGDDECWPWSAGTNGDGYGQFWDGERTVYAHRWSYESLIGAIPDGLQLDHLCRNPPCVNPDHLEPVTNRENVLRGESPPAVNAAKTRCIRGHEFSPENTQILTGKKRGRHCRECDREDHRVRDAELIPCPECAQVLRRGNMWRHRNQNCTKGTKR